MHGWMEGKRDGRRNDGETEGWEEEFMHACVHEGSV